MVRRGTSPRFVGRAVELATIVELVDESRTGEPVTVLVCGEAGVGKSRLVAEVTAEARARGVLTLTGSCAGIGGTSSAFAPFVEAMRPLARSITRLADNSIEGHAVSRLAPLVFGSPSAEADDDPPEADPLGVPAQVRLFEEIRETLEDAAVPHGVLVVIEDLHWADQSSRGMFDFLSRNLRDTAVALVGTVRIDEPDEAGVLTWLAEVQRGPQAVRIDLRRFDRDDLTELVAGILGENAPERLCANVYDRSSGNAFMAEELLAASRGGVVVPAGIRSVVLARMARLTGPARDLLRLAAVAGTSVRHSLLAAAGGLGDADLRIAARELAENYLLVADRSADGYTFRHALTREAVYDELLPGERQQLHREVARALTEDPALGPTDRWAVSEALAEHWYAADDLENALTAAVAAGHAAVAVFAGSSARAHFERALALWNRVRDPRALTQMERHVLLLRAADLASGDGDHGRAVEYIDAAIADLTRADMPASELGVVYERKTQFLWRAGRARESHEWAAHAVTLVPTEPPTAGRASVLVEHAVAMMVGEERYEEALPIVRSGLDVAIRARARKQEAAAWSALGIALTMTSTEAAAGIQEFEQKIAIAQEIGDTEELLTAYSCLADSLTRHGRLDDAATTALKAAEAGVQLGDPRTWAALGLLNAAEALFLGGRWDESAHALQRLKEQREGGTIELWGHALDTLLSVYRGDVERSIASAGAADRLGVDDPQVACILHAARAQGDINCGDFEAAHCSIFEALDALGDEAGSPSVGVVVTLARLGLQIEADRAILARPRRSPAVERDAIGSFRAVATRTLAERTRASAKAHQPTVARSHRALCDAELARAEGRADPDAWRTTADASLAEGQRHPAAYALFREAEAVLARRGNRARAVMALTVAHAIAEELGAGPLRRDVEALATRARIDLSSDARRRAGNSSPNSGEAVVGLTTREREVLRILATGATNPQIAEALFISRKTASHHVSSILTKLGVATRVEAAGVAHRLGLSAQDTPAK